MVELSSPDGNTRTEAALPREEGIALGGCATAVRSSP